METYTNKGISVDALSLVQSARLTYGLRTNDYGRYHRHATRRIATLHRVTGTANTAGRGSSKGSAARKGRGGAATTATSSSSASKQVDAQAILRDDRLVELLVWEAERAWAEGMRGREELATLERQGSNGNTAAAAAAAAAGGLATKRHRSHRRLVKAAEHAERLVNILRPLLQSETPRITASTLLQLEIYSLYMAGTHSFALASSPSSSSESNAAQEGAKSLSTAYVLLESLAKHTERATQEALAFEMLDELEPMIRFCAYKADMGNSGTVADLARTIGQPVVTSSDQPANYADLLRKYQQEEGALKGKGRGRRDQSEAVKNIHWRDLDVPVRSAELSNALGKVQSALQQLEKAGNKRARKNKASGVEAVATKGAGEKAMASYDRALATLSEAEERARKLVEDNATALSKAHSARFESATKPLGAAHSYIVYQLLSLRIARDEALLASTLAKLQHREAKAATSKKVSPNGPLPGLIKRKRAKVFPVLVKLLDGMLQSLDQLRELDIVEEDSEDLAGWVDGKIAFDKARRCLYLAQTYAVVDKYPESLVLSQRASLYIRQVRSSPLPLDGPEASTDNIDEEDDSSPSSNQGVSSLLIPQSALSTLEKQLAQAEDRAKKDWFFYQYAQKAAEQELANGTSALDGAVESMTIDPSKATVSKKRKKAGPLFFDVAFNYVAGIDLDRLDRAANGQQLEDEAQQTPTKSTEQVKEEPGVLAKVKDTVMETAKEVQEAAASALPAATPTTPGGGSGIWGFFGRGKK